MSFEKLVIYIALIMLVLCLVVVFVMLYYANTSKLYPPNIRICPDFHILSPPENNGESDFCKPYYMGDISNTGSTMSCTSTNTTYCPMNVNPSKKDICLKKIQLNNGNLTMDGVTNTDIDCYKYL